MDWGDFLNQTAQNYVTETVAPKKTPAVATNPQTGTNYTEGKPAYGGSMSEMLKNPLVIVGGLAAIGLVVFLAAK